MPGALVRPHGRVSRRGRLLVGDDGRRGVRGQPRLGDLLVRARRHHRGDRLGHAARAACARCSSGWIRPSTTGSRRCSSAGFTPKRIAEHEDAIRAITRDVLDQLEGRETADLVDDVAQPVVARVIGSFMGLPQGDDVVWARLMNTILGANDPDVNPEGVQTVMQRDVPEVFERCGKLIADRRENPTDDLTSVLVHAEVDGEKLEEHEIVMGFFLLMAAGQRQHQGDLLQRDARAARGPRAATAAARRPVADPERGRGGAADVPGVRPLPRAPRRRTPSCSASRSRRATR